MLKDEDDIISSEEELRKLWNTWLGIERIINNGILSPEVMAQAYQSQMTIERWINAHDHYIDGDDNYVKKDPD